MSDAEARFKAENGMSSSEAWDYIIRWLEEGKTDQVLRGCEELLKFFPEHPDARRILDTVSRRQPQAESADAADATQDPSSPQSPQPEQPAKKSGILGDSMGKFQQTVGEQRQKLHEMNPPPPPPKPGEAGQQQGEQGQLPGVAKVTDAERLMGAFCYLYIFVIIPLLMKRDSQFVQFHAWQGVVLTAGVLALSMLFDIVTSPFHMSGGLMLGLLPLLEMFGRVIIVGVYLWAMYNAYSGRWLRLPIIYPHAEKLRRAVQ